MGPIGLALDEEVWLRLVDPSGRPIGIVHGYDGDPVLRKVLFERWAREAAPLRALWR